MCPTNTKKQVHVESEHVGEGNSGEGQQSKAGGRQRVAGNGRRAGGGKNQMGRGGGKGREEVASLRMREWREAGKEEPETRDIWT